MAENIDMVKEWAGKDTEENFEDSSYVAFVTPLWKKVRGSFDRSEHLDVVFNAACISISDKWDTDILTKMNDAVCTADTLTGAPKLGYLLPMLFTGWKDSDNAKKTISNQLRYALRYIMESQALDGWLSHEWRELCESNGVKDLFLMALLVVCKYGRLNWDLVNKLRYPDEAEFPIYSLESDNVEDSSNGSIIQSAMKTEQFRAYITKLGLNDEDAEEELKRIIQVTHAETVDDVVRSLADLM